MNTIFRSLSSSRLSPLLPLIPLILVSSTFAILGFYCSIQSMTISNQMNRAIKALEQLKGITADIERLDHEFDRSIESTTSIRSVVPKFKWLFDNLGNQELQKADVQHTLELLQIKIRLQEASRALAQTKTRKFAQEYLILNHYNSISQSTYLSLSKIRDSLNRAFEEESIQSEATAQKLYQALVFNLQLAIVVALISALLSYRNYLKNKITQSALIEEKNSAIQSLKTQSTFLAKVSHEIRNPIHSLTGIVEGLGQLKSSDEYQRRLQTIERSCHTLLNLTTDILDLSKLQSGDFSVRMIPFSLIEVIQHCISLSEPAAKRKQLSIELKIDSNTPNEVSGDPDRLSQVFLNLLGNSIKFTQKGRIEFRVKCLSSQHQNEILFSISDTGIGIPKEHQDKIFQEFSQGISQPLINYEGTGLGLNISKRLIELMKGRIWFHSEEDVGTTFYIQLPFHLTHSIHRSIPSTPSNHSPRAPRRLLIAEDNHDNCALLQIYLQESPFHLEFAHNGEEVLKKVQASSFDMILMDIYMPIMNGLETLKRLRANEHQSKKQPVPVILLTASTPGELLNDWETLGIHDYLAKPFTKDDLLKKLSIEDPSTSWISNSNRNTVFISKSLEPIFYSFWSNQKKEVLKMESALKESDFETIDHLAHSFKGVTGSYGVPFLCDIGDHIQKAAEQSDKSTLKILFDQAKKYLNEVHVIFH